MELTSTVVLTLLTLTAESMAFIFPEYFDSGMDSCSTPPCIQSTEKRGGGSGSRQFESPEAGDACPICTNEDYQSCPVDLPANCQPGYAICGCCAQCRGSQGATCSPSSVGCMSGLVCASTDGLSPATMPVWLDFQGTCQDRRTVEIVQVTGVKFPSRDRLSHLRRSLRYVTLRNKLAKTQSTFWR